MNIKAIEDLIRPLPCVLRIKVDTRRNAVIVFVKIKFWAWILYRKDFCKYVKEQIMQLPAGTISFVYIVHPWQLFEENEKA